MTQGDFFNPEFNKASLRKIIHIDMDAFYASVEQRDNQEFVGKPVIVGGDPKERGVVATCSYEARKFGVRSAMSTSRAYQLCPQGIFVSPRFERYKAVSDQIRSIFYEYTDLVEPLSLDEAYLDVTYNKKGEPLATKLAIQIKAQIFKETGLTASAGVSFNKFLAKAASDWEKPDGLTVIPPDRAAKFVEKLPIRKFYGVGSVTEKKMLSLGIKTGADLLLRSLAELISLFGKSGESFYKMVHCEDDRVVNPHRVRKSYGKEVTFPEDIRNKEEIIETLKKLSTKVGELLERHAILAKTITLKVRYHDFKTVTRSHTLENGVQEGENIFKEALLLLEQTEVSQKPVRLLGVSASNLS